MDSNEKDVLGRPIKLCELCDKQNGLGFSECISCGTKIWICVFCAPVCLKCRMPRKPKRQIFKPKHKYTTGRIDSHVKKNHL